MDIYFGNIDICLLACLNLTGPYVINITGPVSGKFSGFDIVDIIVYLGGKEKFFLSVKGRVSRWVESEKFFSGTFLIKLDLYKTLPHFNMVFKAL